MAVAKRTARKKPRRVAKVTAPRRRAVKISARKKSRRTAPRSTRPKLNAFQQNALATLQAERNRLTICAKRHYLNEETIAARRFVINRFVQRVKRASGSKRTLHSLVCKISDDARTAAVARKVQPRLTYGGPQAMQRKLEAQAFVREAAVAQCLRSLYAKRLYEKLCNEAFIPQRPSHYASRTVANNIKLAHPAHF